MYHRHITDKLRGPIVHDIFHICFFLFQKNMFFFVNFPEEYVNNIFPISLTESFELRRFISGKITKNGLLEFQGCSKVQEDIREE